ncbi:PDDEXK family nuclease [Limosilactobacillus reuteri]|uniref:hypothetical protein n=1 Tax=Limosilactobacillus reuteri TaxID=1598 RepID=UPI001E2BC647|nr:hypothetical protein [Limosilactobacillus reuteri]MCC4389143.1 hypothetical protein [Limosilactobacillus reuteri]MCC4427781.1 hypothetical protein [Limosilactobacillus reuteri]MCC4431694.1 hypothetical protein [Limosilactobacillus reuteri]MCC4433969.1 hypothetical protein [Limosilactobacillus reuteri]
MPKRLSHQEYCEKIKRILGDDYRVVDKFVNTRTPITILHNKCGQKLTKKAGSFLEGHGCAYCSHHMKKDTNRFQAELNIKYPGEFQILSDYQTSSDKISVLHKKCNNTLEVQAGALLRTGCCSYCYGNRRKTTEQFKRELEEIRPGEFKVLGEYKQSAKPIRVQHKCGYVYEPQARIILKGGQCPKCAGVLKYSPKEFTDKIKEITGGSYLVLDDYVDTRTKIRFKHLSCANIFTMRPNSFISGERCPVCKRASRGERDIQQFLDNNKIEYEAQKMFEGLVDKKQLSYDFYLPELNILIEYQGKQHYKPIDFFGGEETYRKQLRHDELKRMYAKENEIELIEIPYNVEGYLEISEFLSLYVGQRIAA